ncbi:MAG: isopentenyl transferase family protein, partial [Candidatus Riflebacteria bacterium]|nr:isopentenyl transferase family protein [Candidatus Riflebacteria bacterium]
MSIQSNKKPVLAVLGPTASGKTALALDIAREFACEIVNCDSRQIYNEMYIGTACPTPEELKLASHHLFNF